MTSKKLRNRLSQNDKKARYGLF